MWSKIINAFRPHDPPTAEPLLIGSRSVPLLLVRHPRARRYLLRLQPDGTARVTIPRGGTQAEGRAFAERNHVWLENQFTRLQARPRQSSQWQIGDAIWFRGEQVHIEAMPVGENNTHRKICFGSECLTVPDNVSDLRPMIEDHLRALATNEFPAKVMEYAQQHQLPVKRVTVRNQKSRWGSCSRRGTISLNWRLIQTPDWVRDYIILHELAHLRQMNHSNRFWQEVERLCPDYQTAEQWLKIHRHFFR